MTNIDEYLYTKWFELSWDNRYEISRAIFSILTEYFNAMENGTVNQLVPIEYLGQKYILENMPKEQIDEIIGKIDKEISTEILIESVDYWKGKGIGQGCDFWRLSSKHKREMLQKIDMIRGKVIFEALEKERYVKIV